MTSKSGSGRIDPRSTWAARRDVVLTIVGWMAVAYAVLLVVGRLSHTILLFGFAALVAYVLEPPIRKLERIAPRHLAIAIVYFITFGGLGVILYFIFSATVVQIDSIFPTVQALLTPSKTGTSSSVIRALEGAGISHQRIIEASQRIANQARQLSGSIMPILSGIINSLLDVVVVAILSIYLAIDGSRLVGWLRTSTPQVVRPRIEFMLDTFERVVGGYVRGQLLMSTIIGVMVGVGMTIFHVPDALLLGIMAFLFAFIPILGTLVSGAACVLLAFTQGFLIAFVVLGYFVVIHVIEGELLGPRIVGRAVGLHPIVAILAVITGAELFGIAGALLADPVTGVGLAVLQAAWASWRTLHPDEFVENATSAVTDVVNTLT